MINLLEKNDYKLNWHMLNGHPLQSWPWGELKKPLWTPVRLGVFKSNICVSVVTILVRKILNLRIGYVPRGICLKDIEMFGEVLDELKSFGKGLGLSQLIFDFDIDFGEIFRNQMENNILTGSEAGIYECERKRIVDVSVKKGLVSSGRQEQPIRSVVINLSKSLDDILADMRSKHRQYIRKAKRNGVSISERGDIDQFCDVIRQIKKEHNYTMHEPEYFKKAWSLFNKDKLAKLFFAKIGKEVVGSYMILFSRESAYEMFGGSCKKGGNLLSNYLMKWEVIKYCKIIGKKYYDQWGAEHSQPGLVQFKEGFGGEVLEYPDQFTFVYDKTKYNLYKIMRKVDKFRRKFLR